MAIKLKFRLTLLITVLVMAVLTLFYIFTLAIFSRELIGVTRDSGLLIASQIYDQVRLSLELETTPPPTSGNPDELSSYLQNTLARHSALKVLFDSTTVYGPIFSLAVTDSQNRILAHSDSKQVGLSWSDFSDLHKLQEANLYRQLRIIFGRTRTYYEVNMPLALRLDMADGKSRPIGTVHVVMITVFIERELKDFFKKTFFLTGIVLLLAALLAAVFSNLMLGPLSFISAGIERMIRGEFGQPIRLARRDEFGLVSLQLNQIGQRLVVNREEIDALRGNIGQIIRSLEEKLLFVNPKQEIMLLSAPAATLLGLELENSLGKPISSLLPTGHPLLDLIQTSFGLRQNLSRVDLILPGSQKTLQVRVLLIDEKNNNLGALILLQDAETVARLENQLEYARKLAALSKLTSGVAHEVKNPLNAIVIHLELLKSRMGSASEGTAKSLEIITQEIKRLDRVVRSFLNFNRPTELKLNEVSLAQLLQETGALLEVETAPVGIKLILKIPDHLPPIRIDRDLIKQCLLNIAQNGCQAMPGGGTLTIAAAVNRSHVEIQIQDTGAGIAPENKESIFNLYYTTKESGSGIGLALVFKIVQLHNGEVIVDSEIGQGSTFTLRLPVS
jgi:signal transduction histidine kinase